MLRARKCTRYPIRKLDVGLMYVCERLAQSRSVTETAGSRTCDLLMFQSIRTNIHRITIMSKKKTKIT